MRIIAVLFIAISLTACQSTKTNEDVIVEFTLKGEMLFAGANTLQAPMQSELNALAEEIGANSENVKSISVSKAMLSMSPEHAMITESLLLQVVSNNNSLTTIGTLSPLPEGTEFELQLAEEIDLLPYLQDEGGTWVLDANLAEDYMDVISVPAVLNLAIIYSES